MTSTSATVDVTDKGLAINSLIRIALVPIGNINPSTFQRYATMIKKFDTIQLQILTRFQEDNMKSILYNYLSPLQVHLKKMIGSMAV